MKPGRHATILGLQRTAFAVGGVLLCLIGVILFFRGLTIPAVLLVFPGAITVNIAQNAASRAFAGARSEKRVAAAIKRAQPTRALHGVDLGSGGDADHIVLGPVCAVVETKTGRGRVRRTRQGFYVNHRQLKRDPLRQATNQARLLRERTGIWADAVACIVDMEGPPEAYPDGWVCSVRDLPSVLSRLPHRVNPTDVPAIAKNLTAPM